MECGTCYSQKKRQRMTSFDRAGWPFEAFEAEGRCRAKQGRGEEVVYDQVDCLSAHVVKVAIKSSSVGHN